ncbi:MAG: hypothetical protein RLZ35_74 [Pseudomonadota bacterium]
MVATPVIVGLTGGIACGKSSVSGILRGLNVPVIDADLLARELTQIGTPAYRAIVDYFGSPCKQADGNLDRNYLRHRIFSDPKAKTWLEGLLHPLIFDACLKALSALPPKTAYAVLDIPLLIESKLAYPIQAIWVVDTEPSIQESRLKKRDNLTQSQIKAIIEAQASRETRLKKADVIIQNNKTLKELQASVIQLHEKMLRKSAS